MVASFLRFATAQNGQVGHGWAGFGRAMLDTLRGAIPAAVGRGSAEPGRARSGRVRPGAARIGKANTRHLNGCRSLLGLARQGAARLGMANTQHPCGGAEVCW